MKDILKKQKIKNRATLKKFFALSAGVCVITAVVFWWLHSRDAVEQTFWTVAVQTLDASPLPLRVENFVVETAQQHLQRGKQQHLRATAEAIREDPQLAAVQVIKTAGDRVAVFVDLRRPAMVLQVNARWRYLSMRGDIYGSADKAAVYPQLVGVLHQEREYELDEDGLYVLDTVEQQNVQQALDLLQMAMQNGFICEKIIYEQYRGWQAKIADVTAHIFFGHAPFTTKFQKLRDILASLRAKNTQAARIELDYEDKAFVQQKKL